MLTIIAGSILFCVTSFMGIQVKKYYKNKEIFFKEMKDFSYFAENKISLLKTPIKEIIISFIQDKKGETKKILSEMLLFFDDNDDKHCSSIFLNKNESELIFDFLKNIGKTDLKNVVVLIRAFRNDISDLYEKSKIEYTKKGVLYYKLLVLAGIALMLIVI